MKFYLKPNHTINTNSFTVRDEKKNRLFKVKAKHFFGLRLLTLTDMNSQLLYRCKRRFDFTFFKKYTIDDENNNIIAEIYRTRGKKYPKFKIKAFDKLITLEGDLYHYEFALKDENNDLLASMGKRVFPSGEAYEIDVPTDKKPLLFLFLILTIDQFVNEHTKA